jgi:hypothetical protein
MMDGAPELYAVVTDNGKTTLKPLASSQVFSDGHLEAEIEEWVMNGLLEDQATLGDLAVFAQQPTYVAARERRPDLLAIDADKNIAIVEFKRDEADEDILFQTLNYASWVTEQPYEVLNQLAQNFFSRQTADAPESLKTYYYERFPLPPAEDGSEPPLPTDAEFLADFNTEPRIVVVATSISTEVLRILEYLGRHGIRIDAHEFKFFESPQGERFIYRRTAHEPPTGARFRQTLPGSVQYATVEALAQYVRNDAIRPCIYSLTEWVVDEFEGNAVVDRRIPGNGNFRLRVLGQTARLGWYFAQQWMFIWDDEPQPEDVVELKAALSKPDEVKLHPSSGHLRFHVATAGDVGAAKAQIARHVARQQQAVAAN